MMINMFKSKIHRATVTEACLDYRGSLTLDPVLREAAGILVHEKVQVVNINTGDRFETYVIEGAPNSGVVCLNGAAARLGQPGDLIIVITYAMMEHEEAKEWIPTVVHVDEQNRITRVEKSGELAESSAVPW